MTETRVTVCTAVLFLLGLGGVGGPMVAYGSWSESQWYIPSVVGAAVGIVLVLFYWMFGVER